MRFTTGSMEYANSDTVPEGGEYRCTSCGTSQEFEAGDDFAICDACGSETAGWERVVEGAAEEGQGEQENVT